MVVENIPAFDGCIIGYMEGGLFSMAVENIPPFDGLHSWIWGGGLFSMAMENIYPSFHAPPSLSISHS